MTRYSLWYYSWTEDESQSRIERKFEGFMTHAYHGGKWIERDDANYFSLAFSPFISSLDTYHSYFCDDTGICDSRWW